jgi:hypothetical protein
MIDRFPGGHFVEIGVWRGRSAVFMLETIAEKAANIQLDLVDTWLGSDSQLFRDIFKDQDKNFIYNEMLQNLKDSGMEKHVGAIHRMPSLEAVLLYEDASLDFVFIDGDHENGACFNDMMAWYPKIKPNGVLAGHDMSRNAVTSDVKKFCAEKYDCSTNPDWDTWLIEKEKFGDVK